MSFQDFVQKLTGFQLIPKCKKPELYEIHVFLKTLGQREVLSSLYSILVLFSISLCFQIPIPRVHFLLAIGFIVDYASLYFGVVKPGVWICIPILMCFKQQELVLNKQKRIIMKLSLGLLSSLLGYFFSSSGIPVFTLFLIPMHLKNTNFESNILISIATCFFTLLLCYFDYSLQQTKKLSLFLILLFTLLYFMKEKKVEKRSSIPVFNKLS